MSNITGLAWGLISGVVLGLLVRYAVARGQRRPLLWQILVGNASLCSILGMAWIRDEMLGLSRAQSRSFQSWYVIALIAALMPTFIKLVRERR